MAKRIAMPRLGEYWAEQGGVRAGEMRGVAGAQDYQLIVPIHADVLEIELPYGGYGKDVNGATCKFDGWKNTVALVESPHDHPAAQHCRELVIEGFSDFYLPSILELALARVNAGDHFESEWHTSSTQFVPHLAYLQHFASGHQGAVVKATRWRVRPVRRLFI